LFVKFTSELRDVVQFAIDFDVTSMVGGYIRELWLSYVS